MDRVAEERVVSRRRHSAQLRALVLEQCAAPRASVAKVAMSHGLNANMVHGWRKLARGLDVAATGPAPSSAAVPAKHAASMPQFVPVTLTSTVSTPAPGQAANNTSLNAQLRVAARQFGLPAVQQALRRGASPDPRNRLGKSVLLIAAVRGSLAKARWPPSSCCWPGVRALICAMTVARRQPTSPARRAWRRCWPC